MNLFSKIRHHAASAAAAFRLKRRLDLIDRSDVLLAHRVVSRRLPSFKQWRLIGRLLNGNERRALRYGGYLIALGGALVLGRWMIGHAAFAPATGGEYREGIVGSPRSPNPILAGGNDVDQDIVRLVYDGLYRRGADGRLALDLADSAEVSGDGKTYTFRLKDGVMFHDGQKLTSDDVMFTVRAIQDPAWKSPLASSLYGITASAPDPLTVVLASDKPSAYLPSSLTFGILPKHVWENVNPSSRALQDFNLKPIGTGPFEFDRFTRDQQGNILSYTLKAVSGRAKLDAITFKFFDDYDTAIDKLNSNAVDGLNFVSPDNRDAVAALPGLEIRKPALAQYTAVFFNPKKDPALADSSVRQALSYAVDRDKILADIGKLGTLRDQPLPEGSDATVTHYAHDLTLAAKLLDNAGWKISPETGIRTKTETSKPKSKNEKEVTSSAELSVTVTTVDTETNRTAAESIKDSWTSLGVKADVVVVASGDIQKNVIRPREYEALLFGEIIGPDSDPYPFWHSSQIDAGFNLAAFSDRRADELLEKARLAPTRTERDAYLAEFQGIVTKSEPAIFLFQPVYLYPQSNKIKGFAVSMMTSPADRFANVTDWYRKYRISFR